MLFLKNVLLNKTRLFLTALSMTGAILLLSGCKNGTVDDIGKMIPGAGDNIVNSGETPIEKTPKEKTPSEKTPEEKQKEDEKKLAEEALKEAIDNETSIFSLVDGDNQEALGGEIFAKTIKVSLVNKNKLARAGELISFKLQQPSKPASIITVNSVIDAMGIAETAIKAGMEPGLIKFVAVWEKGGKSIEGSLTILSKDDPKVPVKKEYKLEIISGNFQIGLPSTPFGKPLVVKLTVNGQPLANEKIAFEADGFSGGSFAFEKAVTDENGLMSVTYTPGPYFRTIEVKSKWHDDALLYSAEALFSLETARSVVTNPPLFDGCVDGAPVDTSRILLNFSNPQGSNAMRIYRNGVKVGEFPPSSTSFLDSGLQEGETYTYSCRGLFSGEEFAGQKEITVATRLENAPTFDGVQSVENLIGTPNKVLVKWKAPRSIVPASSFKIYATLGSTADFSKTTPSMIVGLGSTEAVLDSLGDELPYKIHVRACSKDGQCDDNVKSLPIRTLDNGAPKTVGITKTEIFNKSVLLTAPWDDTKGKIVKRKVYVRIGDSPGTTLSDYSLLSTETVPDELNVPTMILIANLAEGFIYNFIILDEDSAGNQSANRLVGSISVEDLTPPVFLGITGISRGADEETQIIARFAAITPETLLTRPNGASTYLVYWNELPYPFVPSDPCLNERPNQIIDASSYILNQEVALTISSLMPRTSYKVCIKARDLAGNTSNTTGSLSITTLDKTVPQFDGLKGMTFDGESKNLTLAWSKSLDRDVYSYGLRLWKNTLFPNESDVTKILKDKTFETGTVVSQFQFNITDGDVIYGMVLICDDASLIPGGVNNCMTPSEGKILTVSIPDTTPPPSFPGIVGESLLNSPSEGKMNISWSLPSNEIMGDNYRGFIVYQVDTDGNLIALKDVSCISLNPNNKDCHSQERVLSTQVSGLNAGRTYKFHVRAYDEAGNRTLLDPNVYSSKKKTKDEMPPQLSGVLNFGAKPNYTLSWEAALDNQYAAEQGATLSYQLYRKKDSNFLNPLQPYSEGGVSLISELDALNFTDSNLTEGSTYYYTLCALDTARNRSCDGITKSRAIEDVTAPIISGISIQNISNTKTWKVSWNHSDNVAVTSVRIYAKSSAVKEDASTQDSLVDLNDGSRMESEIFYGQKDADQWVNYLVVISDARGNEASARISKFSQNKITITSVLRNMGKVAGGNLVMIYLTGISERASVTVGGQACNPMSLISLTEIHCIIPASTGGEKTVDIKVSDFISEAEGSSSATSPYQYQSAHPCDRSTLQSPFSGDGANGTAAKPYLICTGGQLVTLSSVTYKDKGYFFEIADNIDLSSYNVSGGSLTLTPMGRDTAGMVLNLDGKGFMIKGFHYTEPSTTTTNTGLFGIVKGASVIKNLKLRDFIVSGQGANVGALAGSFEGSIDSIDFVATVSGFTKFGGLVGRVTGTSSIKNLTSNVNLVPLVTTDLTTSRSDAGGIVGYADVQLSFENIKASTSSNPAVPTLRFGGLIGQYIPSTSAAYILSIKKAKSSINFTDTKGGQFWGGLIGTHRNGGCLIEDSSVDGLLQSSLHKGGFIGQGANLFATTTIRRSSSSIYIIAQGGASGGLIGSLFTSGTGITNEISDSYWSGSIVCSENPCSASSLSQGGGLIGALGSVSQVNIVRSYSSGQIFPGTVSTAGAFLGGGVTANQINIVKSFWFYDSQAAIPGSSLAVTPFTGTTSIDSFSRSLNNSEFKDNNIFLNASWDFVGESTNGSLDVWTMPAGAYPVLK